MSNHSGCRAEIVAHRGASAEAPENTLAAIELAWSLNVDAVEIDVQLSRDGRLMVIHDETLARTAGRGERVSDLTAAQLGEIDVGSWRDSRFASERIPLLADVLTTIPPGQRLFVEIKCGVDGVAALQAEIAACGLPAAAIVVISFYPEVTELAKRRLPDHEVLLVVEQTPTAEGFWSPTADEILHIAAQQQLDGVDLSNTAAVERDSVQRFSQAGLSTAVWTVNSVTDAQRLIDVGVRSLTTDDPRKLIAGLR